MSKKATKEGEFFMDVDGREMRGMTTDAMPKGIGEMFNSLVRENTAIVQAIVEYTGLNVEQAMQVQLAALGALYAKLSYLADKGQAPEELGDWKGNNEKAIEDMIVTFRANARQVIDGTNPTVKKENVQ